MVGSGEKQADIESIWGMIGVNEELGIGYPLTVHQSILTPVVKACARGRS